MEPLIPRAIFPSQCRPIRRLCVVHMTVTGVAEALPKLLGRAAVPGIQAFSATVCLACTVIARQSYRRMEGWRGPEAELVWVSG